jgi:NAD(P)-dependent dehydrogenase (short-subunit alcohol dehydrogenase family)
VTASGVLLITGASRGIGAACAITAARMGYSVAVNYLSNAKSADAVVEKIRGGGGKAISIQGDVSKPADVEALFNQADSLGRLSGLVNNAGILDKTARLDEMSVDRLNTVMGTNVLGSMLCAQQAILRMSTRHGGKGGGIVNLSSVAARLGAPSQYVDYATSKGAIDSLTIGLARELAQEGIRVNAVRPGVIDTEIHASGGIPDRVEQMKSSIPLQRGGSAQEVANGILWLLSDDASYITGAILDITGGR